MPLKFYYIELVISRERKETFLACLKVCLSKALKIVILTVTKVTAESEQSVFFIKP